MGGWMSSANRGAPSYYLGITSDVLEGQRERMKEGEGALCPEPTRADAN